MVGRCRLTLSKPVLRAQRLWFQCLKLQYDEQLSSFAFSFNLRRYNMVTRDRIERGAELLVKHSKLLSEAGFGTLCANSQGMSDQAREEVAANAHGTSTL